MASLALGAAGAVIGNTLLPGIGGSLGWALGAALGNALFPNRPPAQRLHDLHLQGSSYGGFLKIVYGKVRIAGICIWETDLQEHTSGGKGGKGSGGGQASYTASYDLALCETQIFKIPRAWVAGRLNYDFDQPNTGACPWTFYDGNPDQLPDPTEEAKDGAGNVPAYRGISRVVFADNDLTKFGNTLPQWSFEVVTSQGVIPFRVSSFNAILDVSAPYNLVGTYDPIAEIITVGSYINNGPVTYTSKQFHIDGTAIGSATGPVNLDNLGAVVTSNFSGAVNNLQACYCYHAGSPATPNGGWYVGKDLVAPVDLGGEFTAIHPVYSDGFIYAAAGTVTMGINRWVATDGIPSAVIDATVSIGSPTNNSNVYLSASDGFCWVTDTGVTSGSGIAIWKFNADLSTLIHAWTGDDLPPLWNPGFAKVFYKNMVVCNGVVGGNRSAVVYRVEEDFTFTLVGDIDQNVGSVGGPEIQIYNGLILSMDGVVSIDPPDGQAFLSDVVADLCSRAGLTSGQYDVSALTSIVVDGYVIEQPTTCRAAIEALLPVYFFDGVESDGVIKFVVRGGPSVVTFLDDDLAAHNDSSGLPALLSYVRTPDADLPYAIDFSYIDKDSDYQVNTQPWRRMNGASRDVRAVSVAIVLSTPHAKKIVDSWGYNYWTERDAYTWFSSRKYAKYEPTDVCTVQGKVLRITKKTEGATGVIQWEGVLSRGANFSQSGVGGTGPDNGQTLPIDQTSDLVMLDLPLLNDTDATNGVYAGIAGHLSKSYAGGVLYKSLDGVSYDRVAAGRANTMGTATTLLADYKGPNVVDCGNVVRITLGAGGGTLTSCTFDELLNGANEGVLGSEIFQWQQATLVSAGVYDLSDLLRGRRGTEWATSSHVVGDTFVAFNPALLNPPAVFSEIGQTEYYKAVTVGKTVASATAVTFANGGQALKPYSPAYLGGGCDSSGNVTLNWLRRTRIGGGGRFVGPKPLSESAESYVVQIWDASYSVCARIIKVTSQTASYTAAQQVTDFGALQQIIFWTVGQIGAVSIGASSRGTAPSTGSSNVVPLVPIVPFSFNPVISPPPPPGGGAAPDGTLTWPTDSKIIPMTIGQRKVYSFTTGGSTPSGKIAVSEYQSQSTIRHCYIATDSDGLHKVAKSECWGSTATSFFGGGNAVLAASTTYYYVFDFIQFDGTLGGVPPDTNAKTILNLG